MQTRALLSLVLTLATAGSACGPTAADASPDPAARPPVLAERPQPADRPTAGAHTATQTVDLNRASTAELMRLPGVGQRRAQAIIARRTQRRFRTVEELRAVKGFGPKLYRKLRPRLRAHP